MSKTKQRDESSRDLHPRVDAPYLRAYGISHISSAHPSGEGPTLKDVEPEYD
jgi:hypothetical protein